MIYYSLQDFFATVKQGSGWSKDIPYLTERFAYVPVLIYGTHQSHYADHELLKKYPPRGYGTTARAEYMMYKTGDGEPIVFNATGDDKDKAARIKGEVYQLPPSVVFQLDAQMCNGLHLIRTPVHVRWWEIEQKNVASDERQDYLSEAFMYIGNLPELRKLSGFKSFKLQPRHNTNLYDGYTYMFNPMDNVQFFRKRQGQENSDLDAHTHQF
jgi:hypothetical protein